MLLSPESAKRLDISHSHRWLTFRATTAIRAYHALILAGLDYDDHVVPGEFRKVNVGVGTYRPPDWQHVSDLMQRLCDGLNSPELVSPSEHRVAFGVLRAIIAHLYLAWIHAFGDGNGRTARLVEFGILVQAGVPTPAAHVLSNHYNRTRTEYYRELERSSASRGDIIPFITYAVRGLVDGLTEQIATIYDAQRLVLWRDYVYRAFGDKLTKAKRRQRTLVLEMSQLGKNLAIESLLGPYGDLTLPRTLASGPPPWDPSRAREAWSLFEREYREDVRETRRNKWKTRAKTIAAPLLRLRDRLRSS